MLDGPRSDEVLDWDPFLLVVDLRGKCLEWLLELGLLLQIHFERIFLAFFWESVVPTFIFKASKISSVIGPYLGKILGITDLGAYLLTLSE